MPDISVWLETPTTPLGLMRVWRFCVMHPLWVWEYYVRCFACQHLDNEKFVQNFFSQKKIIFFFYIRVSEPPLLSSWHCIGEA